MGRPKKWPPTVHAHVSGRDFVRVNGNNVYLGPTGSAEARAAYARLVAALAQGQAPPAPRRKAEAPATVADAVAAWVTAEAPRLSSDGERGLYRMALAPVLALYGPLPAAGFGARELEAVQRAMATGAWRGEGEGWCARTVNNRVSRVRTVWRWCERAGLVPPGAWNHLRTVPGLRKGDRGVRHTAPRRPAEWAALKAVALAARPPVRATLLLCWWTGMRPAEAYAITPGEIDRSGALWVYRPGKHKTAHLGHVREVVLNRKAQAVLRPFLKRNPGPDEILLRPSRRHQDGHQAAVYNAQTFAHAVQRAAKRAGHEGTTCYRARHAVRLRVTRQQGLDAARSILGHTSVAQTSEYARGVDLEAAKKAAENLKS